MFSSDALMPSSAAQPYAEMWFYLLRSKMIYRVLCLAELQMNLPADHRKLMESYLLSQSATCKLSPEDIEIVKRKKRKKKIH